MLSAKCCQNYQINHIKDDEMDRVCRKHDTNEKCVEDLGEVGVNRRIPKYLQSVPKKRIHILDAHNSHTNRDGVIVSRI